MPASVHLDDREFRRRLSKFSRTMPRETRRGMSNALSIVERKVKTKLSGSYLKARTGKLRADWWKRIDGTKTVTGILGSPTPYSKIQEKGGTITPKRGRALTIPTNENKTAAGVARISARELKDQGRSFIRKGVIFEKRAGGIVPMFILVRSVRIRAKHYLRDSLNESKEAIKNQFAKAIGDAWRR